MNDDIVGMTCFTNMARVVVICVDCGKQVAKNLFSVLKI